jgi:hypothetical protein
MWGSFFIEGMRGRKAALKALAETFRNLAVTQMLKARRPEGQQAV